MTKIKPSNDVVVTTPTEVLSPIQADLATVRTMTTDELRAELSRALQMTADHLRRVAAVVRTLEERGEDLAGLKIGLMPYLRQIAYGQVLPEIVVRYAESPLLVRQISQLPMPDQERLAKGEPLPLAVQRAGEPPDHRMVDPVYLRRDQITLVFARDHIRTVEEQIVILENRPARDGRADGKSTSRGRVRADRKRGGVTIGRVFAPAVDVVTALSDLRGDDSDEGERTKTVPVPLSDEEHRRLKTRSAETDVPMTDLIRRALRAAGLI
jgi:hypothetical protein